MATTILTRIVSALISKRVGPDVRLIELGRQLEVAAAELDDACSRWQGHPECSTLTAQFFDRCYELNREILLMPAATTEGVYVKVRAIKFIYEKYEEIDLSDLTEPKEKRSSASIMNDSLATAG